MDVVSVVWEWDIRQAEMEKKNDLQSGSSSWRLLHKVFQLPSGALCRLVEASSRRLLRCSFCCQTRIPIKNGH